MMKEIDNFDVISNLLVFDDPNDFYYVQIIRRPKDGNLEEKNGNRSARIKAYYIYSLDELQKNKEKIINLCRQTNSRAYIYLNPRNSKEIVSRAIQIYADLLREGRENQGYRVYDSACGKWPKNTKLWFLDIDDPGKLQEMRDLVRSRKSSVFGSPIVCEIPTPNGIHMITKRFDKEGLGEDILKTDSPTLLYYCEKRESRRYI